MPSPLSQRRFLSRDFYVVLTVVLTVAAIVLGWSSYVRLTSPPEEGIYVPRREDITAEVQLLQRYVQIDTSNPPGGELAAARFLLAELAAGGVKAELIESAPGRANVYARIRGRIPGQGLLLIHHMDVVPADEAGWTRPPFSGDIFLNQLWGRGALDMKGIGICHLRAFLDLARSGQRPRYDLVFLATADEEQGADFGVAWLLRNRPDVFEGIRYAMNEGGIPETRAERLMYFGIEIGSKQFITVRLHSPVRENLEKARIDLEPYFEPFDPERILPEVRTFFRAIAPHRVVNRDRLADIDATVKAGEFWALDVSYRALTQNNISPSGIRQSGSGYHMDVVLMNLPDELPQSRLARLLAIVQPYQLKAEVLDTMGPTAISSVETPFFKIIEDTVKQIHGPRAPVGQVILWHQTNDSRYLRAIGIQTYGVSPFLLDFLQSQGIHSVDERVRIDWFLQGVAFTRQAVKGYCLPK